MNAKPKINQKNEIIPAIPGAGDACQLQHIRAFVGLSRRRLGYNDVLRLIDSRQIRWAWDIAGRGARRPEVRIWRDSLIAALAREHGAEVADGGNLTLAQVIEAILPRPAALAMRSGAVAFHELQRRLLCGRNHLLRLVADGELCRVGEIRPGDPPLVLYQSVFEFMKRRSLSI
jgi:hypothetical protein